MRPRPGPRTPTEQLVAEYARYLETARGLAPPTIALSRVAATRFLKHVGYDADPAHLGALSSNDIEAFVRERAQQLRQRTSMRLLVGNLRRFLRFAAIRVAPLAALETSLDTPRIYKQEQLPRALPWDTVQALLVISHEHDPP